MLLFLYLFSGLIYLMRKSGGLKAFSDIAGKHIKSERGVFFLLWALMPFTLIDCGFRVVGAGSITRSLSEKNKISRERFAFMLNNTASPVVELIPIATTFVEFNVAIISIGLKATGIAENYSAYSIWLHAIPLEFFSIILILITFISVFYQFKQPEKDQVKQPDVMDVTGMEMNMEEIKPMIKPRVINPIVPIVSVIMLSVFFSFGSSGKIKQATPLFYQQLQIQSQTGPCLWHCLFP